MFFCFVLRLHETYSVRVGLLVCMWLEKYRPFYVALGLCFSFSLVGGWLNESLGHRLMYQSGFAPRWGRKEEEEGELVLVAFQSLMFFQTGMIISLLVLR